MRALSKVLITLGASLALASCGGGGSGSGSGGIANPPEAKLEVTSTSSGSTPFSLVSFQVRATGANNGAVPDGTPITVRISPATVAIASHANPNTGPNDPIPTGEVVQGVTTGGVANFRLHTRSVGTASITASMSNPGAPNQTVTDTETVNVAAGPGTDPRLRLTIQNPTIPVRPNNVEFFFPSLYSSLVTVTQRRLDGTLVNGGGDDGGGGDEHCDGGSGAAAAIGAGLDFGALFLPAEGIEEEEDEDGNIIFRYFLCRSVTLGMNSGTHDFYVVSDDRQGPLDLTVTAEDPQTGETLGQTFTFNIGGVPQIPASIVINGEDDPLYIVGTNGLHSAQLELYVLDGLGTPVPNPPAGVNNVRLEIVGGGQGGERVRGLNASGAVVQGDAINVPTTNGIGPAQFDAGTVSRLVLLRATADRADNNVDNGIQDPVTVTRQVTVSDGRIFSIEITSPDDRPATANASPIIGSVDSYGLIVEALAVDRFGNTVGAGHQIRWGAIDEPQDNGAFLVAGNDGNPQEQGTLFTAPGGHFITGGGGSAGPLTTLLVFAEDTPNFDMESARIINQIQSETSLTVTQRFNTNDGRTPGSSVDAFNLPYILGRAEDVTVLPTSTTNALGIAQSLVTYPGSRLGKRMAVYAQGFGDLVNNTPELITDVEFLRFQGQGPLSVQAPSAILANRTEVFDVCVVDAGQNGIEGLEVDYSISLPGAIVNGSNSPTGTFSQLTDPDGCIEVTVTTSGVVTSGTAGTIAFTSGNSEPAVTEIVGPTGLLLTATPQLVLIGPNAGAAGISLRLTGDGNPIAGVPVTGECGAPLTLAGQPLPTNTAGLTNAQVNFPAQVPPAPPTIEGPVGTCTFTAGNGPTVTVEFVRGTCQAGQSPPRPGC